MISDVLAAIALGWYIFILLVCAIGVFQICSRFSHAPPKPVSKDLPQHAIPHVTVIRPVKGIEPRLYECLASTFLQNYPSPKLTTFFCVSSRNDPAVPIIERVVSDFASFDGRLLVEEEDPNLSGKNGNTQNLGPNPKVRNMSRAYREAKGDIVWIIDCNVWVDETVAARLVDLLCGFSHDGKGRKYKFVHQLPLAIDTSDLPDMDLIPASSAKHSQISCLGGNLEEMFLSTSHAKFYTAISAVAVAPCTVGKSNMFRRSHLNALTASNSYRDPGIDYFSENICEDHLIGDLLWKTPVPDEVRDLAEKEGQVSNLGSFRNSTSTRWSNHGLLSHSFAIQPTNHLPLDAYLARRTRWLRVRKFTVPLATFVEHGTESLFCSAYGAFGLTTLPWCNETMGIQRTWSTFFALWFFSLALWYLVDSQVWKRLQNSYALEYGASVPYWVKRKKSQPTTKWLQAWVGREIFAFPIWLWAVIGGVTVVWRGRRFWVGTDMKVHEIDGQGTESNEDMGVGPSTEDLRRGIKLRGGAAEMRKRVG